MGFGERWIGWINRCVRCAWVSNLVNGFTGGEFTIEKRLRQGCPLSPLLLNLVAESLPILINQFEDNQ